MKIVLVGLNHETAPVEVRERLAFQSHEISRALNELKLSNGSVETEILETIIVSTCNRVEIYALVREPKLGIKKLKRFLADFHQLPMGDFTEYLYCRSNLATVEHLFSVVSGINSMVLGENQIQGQIKQAFELAQRNQTAGPVLSTLFRNALTVGKRVRNETRINEHSLSTANAAVDLVLARCEDLSALRLLMVGTGKMSYLTVKALLKNRVEDLTIINRTEENARQISEEFGITASGFEKLEDALQRSDVVITSTGAPHTILPYELMNRVMRERPDRRLLVMDIAVPRDVDPEVGDLTGVELFNIDDLQSTIEYNKERRCAEVIRARAIIESEVEKFLAWYQSLDVKPVITDLRNEIEEIRKTELARAVRRTRGDLDDSTVQMVDELTVRIVNKILHRPVVRLRQEAEEGNGHQYGATVRDLFNLNQSEPD